MWLSAGSRTSAHDRYAHLFQSFRHIVQLPIVEGILETPPLPILLLIFLQLLLLLLELFQPLLDISEQALDGVALGLCLDQLCLGRSTEDSTHRSRP